MVYEFFYRMIEAVVGFDSEAADYCNPHGEIYGGVYQIIAEAPDGARYIVVLDTQGEAQAKRQVAKLKARQDAGETLPEEYLVMTDPCYGSAAYQNLDDSGYLRQIEIQEDREAYEGYR